MDSIPSGRFLSQDPQPSTSGSQTSTIAGPSSALATSSDADGAQPATILRLRGTGTRDSRNVQWAEGVVDNEGLDRKKSKVCCIYHRPRAVDESSDESSSSDSDSDSSSSSDEDSDDGLAARGDADQAFRGWPGANRRRPAQHQHTPDCPEHQHGGHDDSSADKRHENGDRQRGGKGKGKGKGKARRRPSPNAYEKIPRHGRPPAPGV